MGVPTIPFCATPPRNILPTAYTPYEFESTTRLSSSPPSASQKPVIGGLSFILSSSALWHSTGGEDFGPLKHERGEDLSSSFCYSTSQSIGSCSLKRDQSPVSVLQAPLSCSSNGVQGPASFRVGTNRLFNGFVRNALESCIEYDSSSFQVQGREEGAVSSPSPVDEFPFDMDYDDDNTQASSHSYAEELLTDAQSRHKIFSEELVLKAFFEAEKAHRGQMRANGDTYLQHCVETGVLLALIGANSTVVAAGLLHDTLDDSLTSYDYIFRTFGSRVSSLVEGVSKLSQLSKLARENNTANKTIEADRLHTMFLAMADARAVLIKLADRLHNMITLDALPVAKQQRFAKETLEIFAPLANRLGIFSWKVQLENLCFKHLYPDQHKELSSMLVVAFDERMITTAIEKLNCSLNEGAISYHFLSGRHKSLYSIYRKMLRKKLPMNEIHDIHGLRLIVQNEDDCYKALRIVHELWSEVPGKLKDYINHPKFNGYQSLHTVVMGEGMVPFEVQIRTKEMHMQAEFGIAAHWRYKESDCRHSAFVVQMVEWARWVVMWQCETMCKYNYEAPSINHGDFIKPPCSFPSHSNDCPYTYIPHDGPIFVIVIETDKMWVQEFGVGVTLIDLMERVGVGFPSKKELRPKVNEKPVSDPMSKLQMGDVINLTPAIPHRSLTHYRQEIQRMYDRTPLSTCTT